MPDAILRSAQDDSTLGSAVSALSAAAALSHRTDTPGTAPHRAHPSGAST